MPYDRHLPGEIMFWDIADIAESLSWEPNPVALKSRLWSLGPDSGRPVPACWVVYTRRLFLVTGDLAGFADAARRHDLTVIIGSDDELTLQKKNGCTKTVVRLLDRDPPQQASPRWWLEQENEWIGWYEMRDGDRREARASGLEYSPVPPLTRWRYPRGHRGGRGRR